jgi:hypothetical protein
MSKFSNVVYFVIGGSSKSGFIGFKPIKTILNPEVSTRNPGEIHVFFIKKLREAK